MNVLVVCAVAQELAALPARAGVDVVAVGVGPVEAAAGTARALAGKRYRAVVNAGIGGGFRDRCAVGDAVIVDVEHYVELGLEDGSAFALPGGLALARTADADAVLLAAARARLARARVLTGVTSATVTSSDARAAALGARYGAGVESMEGFAVLRAAIDAGVPAIELRGVSNVVGDRATNQWNFRAGAAAAAATTATLLDVLQTDT
ncbi:Futalosine hydrolase [Vulcanimicrobium alpinum]|uniref:Futalosine hydrolase n=1 Tax=Vulcanimicrobium alpinum TaxID=3016050 RepID=A0AAN2C8V5_UNVUL|nr:futalosine hydrolase [Vulcanimicrobium alpinum]BDE05669.1 Futalosine hydrolase [Vulcanimicrobium alpinum]